MICRRTLSTETSRKLIMDLKGREGNAFYVMYYLLPYASNSMPGLDTRWEYTMDV